MEERGKMNKRVVKALFSGTLAATVLFHSLGSSSFITFAENNDANDQVKEIQEENESEGQGDSSDNTDETSTDNAGSADNDGENATGQDTSIDASGSDEESDDVSSEDTDAEASDEESEDADETDAEDLEDEEATEKEVLESDTKDEESSEITITYIANNGGKLLSGEETTDSIKETVDLEDETSVVVGASAVADEGYVFANWTYDEQVVSEEENFVPDTTFLKENAPDKDQITFYANYTLEVNDELTYEEDFNDSVTIGDITITAYAPKGVIPDGSKLNVTKVDDSMEQKVKEAASKLIGDNNESQESNKEAGTNSVYIKPADQSEDTLSLNDTITFDITITNSKVKGNIQPQDQSAVTITFTNVIDEADEDTYLAVYYVETSGTDSKTEVQDEQDDESADSSESEDQAKQSTDISTDEATDDSNNETDHSEETVEKLTKVSDSKNNTTDIGFDANHFSTYTITSTRETSSNYTPAEYTPKAYKLLTGTGKTLSAGDFTFTIVRTDEEGNPYSEGSDLYFKESGVPNDDNGLITFSTLSFDTPDTYYFKITEDIPDDADKDPHITYDTNFYILRIYVSEYIDDRNLLVANPAYVKNDTLPPVSVNLYDYYGPQINIDHAFKFSDGTNYYEGTTKIAAPKGFNKYTGTGASDKRVTGIVQPTLVDGYPVLNPDVTGSSESLEYLFDGDSYGVVDKRENVILYKIGDGESYEYVNHAFYPFNDNGKKESSDANNYHFSVVTEAAFIIPENGKVYTEDNPNSTTDMIYEFEGDDDVWVFIDGKLVIDLGGVHDKVGASLNFNTGEIQYYQFTNKNSGSKKSITTDNLANVYGSTWKDGKVHTLKIFYFERGKSLSEFDSNFNLALIAEFDNIYDSEKVVENTSVKFSGTKTLTGRTLAEGEFSFVLKDADGNVIETVTNNADGTFAFSEIEYVYDDDKNDIGEHKYTISEVIGSLSGVTYDTRVYNVTVTVLYSYEEGTLVATIDGLNADGSGANFTNTYTTTPPPPPTPPTPPETPPTYTTTTTVTTTTPVATPAVLGATREVVTPVVAEETPQVLGESRERATGDESRIFIKVLIILLCAGVLSAVVVRERYKKKN